MVTEYLLYITKFSSGFSFFSNGHVYIHIKFLFLYFLNWISSVSRNKKLSDFYCMIFLHSTQQKTEKKIVVIIIIVPYLLEMYLKEEDIGKIHKNVTWEKHLTQQKFLLQNRDERVSERERQNQEKELNIKYKFIFRP